MQKVFLTILFGALVFTSCGQFSLTDYQKQSGDSFERAIGNIDPSQSWNIALQGTSAKGITVTPAMMTKGNNGMTPISFEGIEMKPAQFFRVIKQGNEQFKVKLVRIESEMDELNIGAYYYDDNKVLHETLLYENVSPENYSNGAVDVRIEGGLYFGIWVECMKGADTVKYYSEARLNADGISHTMFISKAEYRQQTSNHPYIFIEDGTGTEDFQDIVLQVSGNEELEEWTIAERDKELAKWTIAGCDEDLGPWTLFCEDVGTGGDYDFNDVVLTVTKREGQNAIDIEYLATGSTNPVYVFLGDMNLGEVHALFGVDTKRMVNTYAATVKPVRQEGIDVEPGFTMSSENMGGFRVVRGTEDGPESVYYKGQTGLRPFLICVPAGTAYCVEQTSIFEAYPKFLDWARDRNVAKDWYLEPVSGSTVALP